IFDLKALSDVQIGLVSKLHDELIVIQTQLDQVKSVTPENPQIPGLIARENSLRKEISQQMKAISCGGEGSLSNQAA
ncbi:capsule biosynthesis protein, partial [Neisseria sp. P0017.S002]